MNGYLSDEHPKPTRDQFVDNFRKLRANEKALMKTKNKIGQDTSKEMEELL